jgi:hypothetical protein
MSVEGGAAETKADFELERYKSEATYQIELLKATVAFEHAALKPLPLLNGGAIIAMLTFAGNTASVTKPLIDGSALRMAVIAWSCGLVSAVLSLFAGYWSQHFFLKSHRREIEADKKKRNGDDEGAGVERGRHECLARKGAWSRRAAYLTAAISLTAFVVGGFYGIKAVNLSEPSAGTSTVTPSQPPTQAPPSVR